MKYQKNNLMKLNQQKSPVLLRNIDENENENENL